MYLHKCVTGDKFNFCISHFLIKISELQQNTQGRIVQGTPTYPSPTFSSC